MTLLKAVSDNTARQLLANEARKPSDRVWLTDISLEQLKVAVDKGLTFWKINGRPYKIRYFVYRNEAWICVMPIHGLVPMFQMGLKDFLNSDAI